MIDNLEISYPEDLLEQVRCSGKPNLLWGGGWAASLAQDFLKKHQILVDAIIVDIVAPKKDGPKVEGVVIVSPEAAAEQYQDINLICGFYTKTITQDFSSKVDVLNRLGVSVCPYLFDLHLMMYPERRFSYDFISQNDEGLNRLEAKLSDQLSRDTLKAFLEQRLGMCYGPLEPLVVPDQYFTETVFSLNEDEVLVDCGAFDGDTIRDFQRALEKQIGRVSFEKIFAFEPNRDPFIALVDTVEKWGSITCIQKGVWNEPCELRFSGDKARSSKIDLDGDVVINVDRIDAMLGSQRISIIKMDLEGAELQALQGAENLIRQHTPLIAVCVYHKNDDLFTIPGFIDSLALPYHYYLRAHESKSGELVLYCVPEGRRRDVDGVCG